MFFKEKKNHDFLSIKIEKLIDWNEPNGEGCIVSDRITKDGFKVDICIEKLRMKTAQIADGVF